jgi:DMSO/TMAO reductase YedYZ heme-binding membrane subunit
VFVFAAQPSAKTIYGGGATYLLIAAMALTSNNWSVRALGARNWKALHTIAGLAIAIVFTVSYLGRLDGKAWLAIPALTLLGSAALLKLLAWMKKR